MIETLLLAVLLAHKRGYALRGLRQAKLLYPIYLFEVVTLGFQASIFFGVYTFIPYAPIIKTTYMVALALPLICYQQYRACLVSAGCVFAGSILNNLAMAANGGKMPVYPTLSYLTGYVNTRNLDLGGSLRGGGDATFNMISTNICLWLVGIPLVFVAGFWLHWPMWAVFLCTKLYFVIKAICCQLRFNSGKWIKDVTSAKKEQPISSRA